MEQIGSEFEASKIAPRLHMLCCISCLVDSECLILADAFDIFKTVPEILELFFCNSEIGVNVISNAPDRLASRAN